MERIGRYQIVRELGRGAMGVVYLATDPNIGRPVAIKTIRLGEVQKPDERERLRERLFREARSAGMLSHPGIVTIYDVDQQGDLAFIAMEFVDGPTLDQLLSHAAIPPERMFSVLGQAAAALDYAHAKGIVHRDIKPANIMIAADGTTKITDFGIAKVSANEHLTITGTIVGTPHYMSPEQVQGLEVDGRSDQFSLAVIAYEMLTGEKPFTGDHLTTVVYKIVAEEPAAPHRLNATLAGPIENAMRKALAKRPEQRYATCQEFAGTLEKACAGSPGWKAMPRGGSLNEPTVMDAARPASAAASVTPASPPLPSPPPHSPLPPSRRARGTQTVTVERSAASRPGFWAFLMAILVAAGLLALLGWQSAPWLNKGPGPQAEQKQASAGSATSATPATAPPASDKPAPMPAAAPAPEQPAAPPVETQTAGAQTPSQAPAPDGGQPPPEASAKPPQTVVPPAEPPAEQPTPAPARRPARPVAIQFPVTIVSSPGGATATLDGRAGTACTAPCSLPASPGRHTIAITMPGYQIEHREVEVGTGPIELPAVILRAQGGTLLVTSDPPGASILLNGRKLPQTTPAQITLAPGTYNITVEKDGKQATRPVEVHNGVINYLKLALGE